MLAWSSQVSGWVRDGSYQHEAPRTSRWHGQPAVLVRCAARAEPSPSRRRRLPSAGGDACGRTGKPSLSGRIVVKLTAVNETSGRSFGRTVVAALVLLVAGYFLLTAIIHVISFLLGTVLLVVAVVAVIWALRILL